MTPSENLEFKIKYIEAKKAVGNCKEKIVKYSSEENAHLTNMWRENLSDAEHTLRDFEIFLSIFPRLKEFCYEETMVLDG